MFLCLSADSFSDQYWHFPHWFWLGLFLIFYLFTSFSSNLEFPFNEAVVQEVVFVCDILDSICIVTYKPIKGICKLEGLCMYVLI